LDVEKVQ
jgi:hypothetical protein